MIRETPRTARKAHPCDMRYDTSWARACRWEIRVGDRYLEIVGSPTEMGCEGRWGVLRYCAACAGPRLPQ